MRRFFLFAAPALILLSLLTFFQGPRLGAWAGSRSVPTTNSLGITDNDIVRSAVARAKHYWHATPCQGHVQVTVGSANDSKAVPAKKGNVVSMWVSFDTDRKSVV